MVPPSRPKCSASPPRVTLKSSGTTQSQLQTQGLQPGGTQEAWMPTPHSSMQSPTQTLSCSEGKHFTLHYIHYAHSSKPPEAACDLMALCTKKFRICVHPNSHNIFLLRPFWKRQPYKFGPLHPHLQACGMQLNNSQKKQTFVLIFFEDLDFSD